MYLTELKLLGAELDDDETYRGDCLACRRSRTFTITRSGTTLVYNCYSTNCDFRGVVCERGSKPRNLTHSRFGTKSPKLIPYTGELEELTNEQRQFLLGKIHFTQEHCDRSGVLYARIEDRFAYPIFAPSGKRRGWVLRSYNSGEGRKAITRLDVHEPHLSWYGPWRADSVLVVEDIPSAVRASFHVGPVVSMCGGGISRDAAYEIKSLCRNVIWAFDQDASARAIEHHQKYKINFDTSRVLLLERDLKDMSEDDLRVLLMENNNNNERAESPSSSHKVEESV